MLTEKEKSKEVQCARFVHRIKGLIWILFDKEHELEGNMRESRNKLITRWKEKYGKFGILTRIKGVCRIAELVASMSQLRSF